MPSVRRVDAEARGLDGADVATVFAVFEHVPPSFLGLVTAPTMGRFPHRIFADLVAVEPQSSIAGEVSVELAAEQLRSMGANVLAARDVGGEFLGALTRESMFAALLRREQQLNEALRGDDQRLKAIFSAMPDRVFVIDSAGVYRARPAMHLDTSSHVLDGDAGQTLEDVLPGVAAALVRGAMVACLASGALQTVTVHVGDFSHPLTYELRIVPSEAHTVLCIARDATEVNRIKAQLIFADRMVAVGTLAASIAHEINNPLTYIGCNVAVLRRAVASLSPIPGELADAPSLLVDIHEGVARIASLVSDLRVFGKGDTAVAGAVDLARVLRSALNIAAPHFLTRAQIVTDLRDVPRIQAVESRLGQVFVNLLINAAQAIPEGKSGENRIEVRLYTEADQIHVIVADSGAGLSPDARAHLFEAFFTTKGVEQQGTGLGLFISNNIVVALGGHILIEDGIRGGCAFHVVLPVVVPSAESIKHPSSLPPPVTSARVLVIDDEPAILRVIPTLLSSHVVEVALDGRTALSMIAERGPYDVILCDIMMPQMSGMDVYREACARWPEVKRRFVFLTAGAHTMAGRAFVTQEGVSVLDKPLGRAAACAAVNRIVHRCRPALPLAQPPGEGQPSVPTR